MMMIIIIIIIIFFAEYKLRIFSQRSSLPFMIFLC
jgi:hypothetical protein